MKPLWGGLVERKVGGGLRVTPVSGFWLEPRGEKGGELRVARVGGFRR